MIELLNQFSTIEHSVLIALVELNSMVWASTCAEHAEHTSTKVVFVFHQTFFLLTIWCFIEFACYFNCAIRTSHLAQSATHAFMLIMLIVRHCERTTETIEHFICFAVLRVLLGNLWSKELAHGCFQTSGKALQSINDTAYITFFFHEK